MKKLTIEDVALSHVKGGDWGDGVNIVCGANSVLKFGYGFAYVPLGAFCVGWGVSKLLYK